MPVPSNPAGHLLAASFAGEPDAALEDLYREKHAQFLRVARAITADSDSAYESVQEGFARALRGSEGLQRVGALEPWVWRIVVNAARDRRRADARRHHREVGEAALESVAAPDAPVADRAVLAAVAALPRATAPGAVSEPLRGS